MGLFAAGSNALAASSAELIKTAEAACLEAATAQGWRADLAKVISSKALSADKVEVVFDLSKDGVNTARLTCPYTVGEGVGGSFAARTDAPAESAAAPVEAAPIADAGTPVDQGKAWWLLLPLALGLGSWLWLRGRDDGGVHSYATSGTTTGAAGGARTYYAAEAAARDGLLEVREQADLGSRVLRQIRNGDTFQLTGIRRRDASNVEWLEVNNGGWVRDAEVRYDRNVVRFT
ncbi:MAG: SH3 domain-containing protein [Cyanobium sp.]